MDVNEVASIISKNNAGEQQAIEGYYDMLNKAQGLPARFYEDIHEIISDEMHHTLRLSYWVEQFTGVKPAKS
jgi:rubrerythrin